MRESATSGGSGPSWSGRPDGGMSDRASAWARVAGRPGQMSRADRVVRTGGVGRAVESPEMPDPLLSRRVFLADLGRGAAAMADLGLGWSDIGNVILTHRHPDHAGSIDAILAAAPDAVGSIGAADLAGVTTARPLTAVSDGDEVFGLQIVATPGHTAGHISVF